MTDKANASNAKPEQDWGAPQEDWASEVARLMSSSYSPGGEQPQPPASPSYSPPSRDPSPVRKQHVQPKVTGQTHLKAIRQCNMEMIADKLFGLITRKAPGKRACFIREYGMQEYFKNPITGWTVYYNTLFDEEGCQPVDYIEQIKRAVVKLSDGKLKLQIEIMHKCKITVSLEYV